MKKFYDTNALLHNLKEVKTNDYFLLSSKTLEELENIKTSGRKNEDIKFKARKVTRYLKDNEDTYECIVVKKEHYKFLEDLGLEISPDNLIMVCAKLYEKENNEKIVFITNDICCYNLCKNIFKLEVQGNLKNTDNEYKGFKEIALTDEELSDFYKNNLNKNTYNLSINQYLIIKNSKGDIIQSYKWDGEYLREINVNKIESDVLGEIKPYDIYQKCLLDSFENNQITMAKGKAGSGKSWLSLGYLFHKLKRHAIDKIIIFVNPVPTNGVCELGYYPGTKEEKMLSGNIGNFLSSKLGGKDSLEILMQQNKIELLPMSDIRGYDTTGMKAGIYITEAQNMSIDLMKLALQRIGEDCICIIDGDYNTQVDNLLFSGENNGMKRMSKVFRDSGFYGEVELNNIYRSEIAKIADRM